MRRVLRLNGEARKHKNNRKKHNVSFIKTPDNLTFLFFLFSPHPNSFIFPCFNKMTATTVATIVDKPKTIVLETPHTKEEHKVKQEGLFKIHAV